MYSPRIIERNLDAFAIANGWRPVYNSVEWVMELKSYIDSITSSDVNTHSTKITITKQLTAQRQREMRRWIQNEQALCSLDAGYWQSRYAFICNEKGEIFQFKNRRSQDVFDKVVADLEERGVSIELLILKARQEGVTTKTALNFLHRMLFVDHTQSVMASVQAEKSELIGRILNICFEHCPWWLVPRRVTERVGKMMEWANGSILSIQSGMQPTGIAQGWTPVNIHVSELADIPNPKKVIEEGLLRATHSSRKLFMVFEGTGGGNTGWLADKWRASKEGWPSGRSRFMPVFLPWPLATDLYPELDWLKKFPVPDGWMPSVDTRKHIAKCELYIRSTTYLAAVCGLKWSMPREQQWFWEFNYLEAVASHTQKIWFSQMPADDYEALTGLNDSVFQQETIEVHDTLRQREFTAYAITGDSIDEGFEPDETLIDYDLPRISVSWTSHRGQHYTWVMIPLLPFDETNERLALDRVIVFQPPIANRDYSIGIDTADGLGKEDEDRSVCTVTMNATGANQDIQCCEFVSNRINAPQVLCKRI